MATGYALKVYVPLFAGQTNSDEAGSVQEEDGDETDRKSSFRLYAFEEKEGVCAQ